MNICASSRRSWVNPWAQERLAAGGGTPRQQAAAQKEADRIRKMLLELDEYEHDVLYPLASRQIEIDLDDGVN